MSRVAELEDEMEWFDECKAKAADTDSLNSFELCVARVKEIGQKTGVAWFRPMFSFEADALDWSAGGMHGGIIYDRGSNVWRVHT